MHSCDLCEQACTSAKQGLPYSRRALQCSEGTPCCAHFFQGELRFFSSISNGGAAAGLRPLKSERRVALPTRFNQARFAMLCVSALFNSTSCVFFFHRGTHFLRSFPHNYSRPSICCYRLVLYSAAQGVAASCVFIFLKHGDSWVHIYALKCLR